MGSRAGHYSPGHRGSAHKSAAAAATSAAASVAAASVQPPQPSPSDLLGQLSANPRALLTMSDADANAAIKEAMRAAKVAANQNDTDTQKFFNAIGWTKRKPKVLGGMAYENAKKAAGAYSMYHTDDTYGSITDASVFARQFMTGDQFLSNGIHGDGTYWALTKGGYGNGASRHSWAYGGNPGAAQIKAFLNTKARIVSEDALDTLTSNFKKSHPKTYKTLFDMKQDYSSDGGTMEGAKSIIAAAHGYNAITAGGYLTLLDRSAVTVSATIAKRPYSLTNAYNW